MSVLKKGAKIFIHPVKNPNLYGVATIDKKNKIIKIIEKLKKYKIKFSSYWFIFF